MAIATSSHELSHLIAGDVVTPADPRWDAARTTFNVLDDQRPDVIVFPADARDVARAVAWARERGLRVAPQSTGHNAGPLGSLEDTVILHVSRLNEARIDGPARTVRAGAATKWERITPGLSELGLAGLHGSSPDVGVAGYSLGGGMGWLARKHGLQTNSVTAIELVTADGRLIRADYDHEPELFWALRGGGGNYGVVTSVEFRVHPVPELYAGVLFFGFDRARDLLAAWVRALPSLPDELMTWASLIRFPDLPIVPGAVRGRAMVLLYGAFLGSEADGRELLASLRAVGPELDTFAMVPTGELGELAMDPPDPLPYRSTHRLLTGLPDTAIDELVDLADPAAGSPLLMLQLRHMGGALGRRGPGAGARATLPGEICLYAVGVPETPAAEADLKTTLSLVDGVTGPFEAGFYPNFVEDPTDAASLFDGETWSRLRAVKAAYDADDVFKGNHHVPPA